MKITIISPGIFKNSDPYAELFYDYRKRIKWDIKLLELKIIKKSSTVAEQKRHECEQIMKNLNGGDALILLDEKGINMSTGELATQLTNYSMQGKNITFIIGGADGIDDTLRSQANLILSFGKMVFPHRMVRVMLVEQLYRIYSLQHNHPYHRE